MVGTTELQQITLHPDVISKLSESISMAISVGLKAGNSVLPNAEVASIETPHSVIESN